MLLKCPLMADLAALQLEEFRRGISKEHLEIDLARAALMIAWIEHPGLGLPPYLWRLDGIAAQLNAQLPQVS